MFKKFGGRSIKNQWKLTETDLLFSKFSFCSVFSSLHQANHTNGECGINKSFLISYWKIIIIYHFFTLKILSSTSFRKKYSSLDHKKIKNIIKLNFLLCLFQPVSYRSHTFHRLHYLSSMIRIHHISQINLIDKIKYSHRMNWSYRSYLGP